MSNKTICLECEELNERIKPMSGERLLCDKCQPQLKIKPFTNGDLVDTPEESTVLRPEFCETCYTAILPNLPVKKCFSCLRAENPQWEMKKSIDTPQSNQVTLNDHDKKVEEAIEALKAIDFVNNLGDEQLLRQLLFTYVGRC